MLSRWFEMGYEISGEDVGVQEEVQQRFIRYRDDDPDSDPDVFEGIGGDNDNGRYLVLQEAQDDYGTRRGDLTQRREETSVGRRLGDDEVDDDEDFWDSCVAGTAISVDPPTKSVASVVGAVSGGVPVMGHTLSLLRVQQGTAVKGGAAESSSAARKDEQTVILSCGGCTAGAHGADGVRLASAPFAHILEEGPQRESGTSSTGWRGVRRLASTTGREPPARCGHVTATFTADSFYAGDRGHQSSSAASEDSVLLLGGCVPTGKWVASRLSTLRGRCIGDAWVAKVSASSPQASSSGSQGGDAPPVGVAWQQLTVFNAPASGRYMASLVAHDRSARGAAAPDSGSSASGKLPSRFILFGGTSNGRTALTNGVGDAEGEDDIFDVIASAELFELRLEMGEKTLEYFPLVTTGALPEPRWGHAAASLQIHGEGQSMVVHGGVADGDRYLSSTHILNLDTLVWRELAPPSAFTIQPRALHAVVPLSPPTASNKSAGRKGEPSVEEQRGVKLTIIGGESQGAPVPRCWELTIRSAAQEMSILPEDRWCTIDTPLLQLTQSRAATSQVSAVFETDLPPLQAPSSSPRGPMGAAVMIPRDPSRVTWARPNVTSGGTSTTNAPTERPGPGTVGGIHGPWSAAVPLPLSKASGCRDSDVLVHGGLYSNGQHCPVTRLCVTPSLRQQAAIFAVMHNLPLDGMRQRPPQPGDPQHHMGWSGAQESHMVGRLNDRAVHIGERLTNLFAPQGNRSGSLQNRDSRSPQR